MAPLASSVTFTWKGGQAECSRTTSLRCWALASWSRSGRHWPARESPSSRSTFGLFTSPPTQYLSPAGGAQGVVGTLGGGAFVVEADGHGDLFLDGGAGGGLKVGGGGGGASPAGTVGVLGVTAKVTASTNAVTTAPNTKVRVLDRVRVGRNRIGVSL